VQPLSEVKVQLILMQATVALSSGSALFNDDLFLFRRCCY
jgi:hypothetical protein